MGARRHDRGYSGRQGRHASFVYCTDHDDMSTKESTESSADYESDYDEIIAKDKSIQLQLNRLRQITLEVCIILSKQCSSYMYDMIKPIKETGHNLRKKNVDAPSFKKITYGKKSFKYRGSVLWNDLPNCTQTSEK